MDFKHFKAGKDDDGRRLDKIIRRFLNENELSSIYKSLRKGLIKVNGRKCDGNFRITNGDDISIADFLTSKQKHCETKSTPIDEKIILFKNKDLLILNKPYNIPVQPAKEFIGKSLSEMVEDDFEFYHQKKESISFKTGPLHRLDRKTTGVLTFSQSLLGAKVFSKMMQNHEIHKTYIGLVVGTLQEKKIWQNKIEKSEENKGTFHTVNVFENDSEQGKESYTEATPLSYGKYDSTDVTLVKFLIKTGRTHQIRAQSAKNGFPLLGDTAYGAKKVEGCGRNFYLHAFRLEFDKAIDGIPKKIEAPVDKEFKQILSKTGCLTEELKRL